MPRAGEGDASKTSSDVCRALLDRRSIWAAPVLLLASFFVPTHGFGFTVCAFKALTALPCPACGLGRSLACVSHLSLGESIRMHPFGPLLYAFLLALAFVAVMGETRRARLRAWLDRRARGARLVHHGVMWMFIGFGLARLGLKLIFRDWFPDV